VAQALARRPAGIAVPALVAAAGERAGMRFLEFFAANVRNPHTRRAYARAAEEFLAWCADADVASIAAVQPVHVATCIETATRELAAPSVKQRLAANHASTRTMQLYDRRRDELSLDEVERIVI
jgi:site-specific recombinase XerC